MRAARMSHFAKPSFELHVSIEKARYGYLALMEADEDLGLRHAEHHAFGALQQKHGTRGHRQLDATGCDAPRPSRDDDRFQPALRRREKRPHSPRPSAISA